MIPSYPKRPDCGSGPRHGFTLIELLIVVAILALLLSVLVPSLGGARDAAQRAKCLANMKQIGVAYQLYFNENNDQFIQPAIAVSLVTGQPSTNNARWFYGGKVETEFWERSETGVLLNFNGPDRRPLNRYFKYPERDARTAKLFECPDDNGGDFDIYIQQWGRNSTYEVFGNSYPGNPNLFAFRESDRENPSLKGIPLNLRQGMRLSDVRAPTSDLVLASEYSRFENLRQPNLQDIGQSVRRHGNDRRLNLVFLDGSARWTEITFEYDEERSRWAEQAHGKSYTYWLDPVATLRELAEDDD